MGTNTITSTTPVNDTDNDDISMACNPAIGAGIGATTGAILGTTSIFVAGCAIAGFVPTITAASIGLAGGIGVGIFACISSICAPCMGRVGPSSDIGTILIGSAVMSAAGVVMGPGIGSGYAIGKVTVSIGTSAGAGIGAGVVAGAIAVGATIGATVSCLGLFHKRQLVNQEPDEAPLYQPVIGINS